MCSSLDIPAIKQTIIIKKLNNNLTIACLETMRSYNGLPNFDTQGVLKGTSFYLRHVKVISEKWGKAVFHDYPVTQNKKLMIA